MHAGRILIVDNEPQIRRVMKTTLIAGGFEVEEARRADDAIERVRSAKYDVVLLDVNMPGTDGLEACKQIRGITETPVIMLTVRNTENDKVQAFEAGADDYITKPFSTPELLARIHAVVRRNLAPALRGPAKIQLGDVEVDFEARQINSGEKSFRLTPKEFDLLSFLAAHANQTISHQKLLRAIWGPEYGNELEYLRVFINHLRKKLERIPAKPQYLLTEPWTGYRLRLTTSLSSSASPQSSD